MLISKITVLAQSAVGGPDGNKLKPGEFYAFEDSKYLRLLIKSEAVVLVDPPSLDPDFLERTGYGGSPAKAAPKKAKTSKKVEPSPLPVNYSVYEEIVPVASVEDEAPSKEVKIKENYYDGTGDNDQEKDN